MESLRCTNRNLTGSNPIDLPGISERHILFHGDDLPDDSWLLTDLESAAEILSLSERENDRLYAEIGTAVDRASDGSLVYAESVPRDVVAVKSQKGLYELRLPKPRQTNGRRVKGRIYMHEPREENFDGVVMLLFHVKEHSIAGLDELQNTFMEHAACTRLPHWESLIHKRS